MTTKQVQIPIEVTTTSKVELRGLEVRATAGALPPGLRGHLFVLAPVGSPGSPSGPLQDAYAHVFNGDGMLYRFDLGEGGARVTSRLMRTPCHYLDEATARSDALADYRFLNAGFLRRSDRLGLRNQLHTAPMPVRFPNDATERLIVTYDAGRPWEVDPTTLELVTPVGRRDEWAAQMLHELPFKPCLTTAHPAFDPSSGELFAVNFSRSLRNILQTVPFVHGTTALGRSLRRAARSAVSTLRRGDRLRDRIDEGLDVTARVVDSLGELAEMKDRTYLLRWRGDGAIERWRLVTPDGRPIRIEQSVHQVAVTRDYVVAIDCSIKVGIPQVFGAGPLPGDTGRRLWRQLLSRPQRDMTTVYLIPRRQLVRGERPSPGSRDVVAVAQRLVLPMETAHFMADYDDPDGIVTLYLGHSCATDIAESVRDFDMSYADPDRPVPRRVRGMIAVGAMDINRLGKYRIDAERARVVDAKVLAARPFTWGLALATALRSPTWGSAPPPARLSQIYWTSAGCYPELLTRFVHSLYEDYPHRMASLEELRALHREGELIPSTVFRVDTRTMEIADSRLFAPGEMPGTPLFVPRDGAAPDDETDGFVVVSVFTPEACELWVLDGRDLSKRHCVLRHPSLDFGLTLHAAWMPIIERRTATYAVDLRRDYDPAIAHDPRMVELFERHVYPHFEPPAAADPAAADPAART